MCGIAGVVGIRNEDGRARVGEALERLRHRGPDGEGVHESPGVVIGMRRLAIIDLSGGDQPIYNEDGSVAVVCNGELYNYVEQFAALEGRGHKLQSRSDINLIPHLYEERGRLAFRECRGMFAAAIWDERRRTLTLARDRVGKKPLFWSRVGGGIAFASELPALLALLDAPPSLSIDGITAYLQLSAVPHPLTIYDGVNALPPGCTLEFSPDEETRILPYWAPAVPAPFNGNRREALDALDSHVREAVALRLRSDVPVGLFLSGGIDSGLVASYAQELGARDLTCFVVEMPDATLNEAPLARQVARSLGLPIQTISVPMQPISVVERVSTLYGQPFGDSSAIPVYLVAQAARSYRKVVLNGDGGDEIFAGYRRYWLGRLSPWTSEMATRLHPVLNAAGSWLSRHTRRRTAAGFVSRALRGLGADEHTRYVRWTGDLLDGEALSRLFPALVNGVPPVAELEAIRRERFSARGLLEFQQSDYRLILADDLLSKMDIATMANSIEARSPFLDVPLAEFAWSLPASWLISATETKPLLRELARRRLPHTVATAPKRGFEVPVEQWMRGELRGVVADTLLAPDSRTMELADPKALRAFVDGQDAFAGNRPQSVWTLLMLELFLRAKPPETAASSAPRTGAPSVVASGTYG
jgi:asparagine synthase (glutamine-hydrolysing)